MIKIFVTGGTFDKEYNELNGTLAFKQTHMKEMLALGRAKVEVDITALMLKDSLEITNAERESIAQNCFTTPHTKIVITHGTDTMAETAKHIAQHPSGRGANKTIVLTGAMIPYAFGSSDGLFNMGSALAFVQTLPPGVYIAMNGRCFNWDNVRKNREAGEFEVIK